MDDLDRYLALQGAIADELVAESATSMVFVQAERPDARFDELRELRTKFLDQRDRDSARGYLESRMFASLDLEGRFGALVACFELDDEIAVRGIQRRFVRYEPPQPLFDLSPELWPHVWHEELVAASSIEQLGRSELMRIEHGWGRLDPFLPPELFRWARSEFHGAPLWVRLDPWFASREKPLEPLRESAVRPARPGWWRGLGLREGERTGAHYVLDVPGSPKEFDRYYEYHLRKVRTLELHVRRSGGNLEMLLEELALDGRRQLIGRCIHLDTGAPPETGPADAPVLHLDLAVNAYLDDAVPRRLEHRLSSGTIVDASVRTHLLRIEGIPFASCLEFARQFFHSSVLLAEWQNDLFR